MTHVVFMDWLKVLLVYDVYFHTHPIYVLWLFITFYKLIVCIHAYGILKHNMRVTCNIVELMALWLVAYGKSICMGQGTIYLICYLVYLFLIQPLNTKRVWERNHSTNIELYSFLFWLVDSSYQNAWEPVSKQQNEYEIISNYAWRRGWRVQNLWTSGWKKTIYTSGSIVNTKIQEMKQYVYVIASTEHTMWFLKPCLHSKSAQCCNRCYQLSTMANGL